MAGIETVPIHYRGGGPAMQDLVAGQVQVMLIQGGGAIAQHVKAGKLTALAVSTAERSKFYPDLPTIAETLSRLRVASPGSAIFAPARRPEPVLERLHAALAKILGDPGARAAGGAELRRSSAAAAEALTELVKRSRRSGAASFAK